MKTSNYRWLASVIAAHEDHRVVGRTRLQKTVKLLQRLGMPTDYVYSIFFYGPYSEGVFRDVQLLIELGLVTEEVRMAQEGATPYFVMQARADGLLPEFDRWHPPLQRIQDADLVVLELAATFDAFREMGSDHDEALARLRHKKASKWSEEREIRALDLLRALELFPAAERGG